MLGYLSLDIICSSKLTVSEQIMFADKYPSIFSRQMKAIVYIVEVLRHMENSAPRCSFRTLCKIMEIKIGGKTRFENLLKQLFMLF